MERVSRIVVVGGGQAGGQAVDSLRREGFDGEIFLVTEEHQPPYQRPPLSKDYLAGRSGLDRVLLRPEAFYAESSIELITGTKVASIDPGAHRIELATGRTLDYDRLLLATGSRVRRLEGMPGGGLEGVLYLRTIEDSDRIRAAMDGAERVAVVGGGYIGLEVASVAAEAGLAVTVVETLPRLLSRVATGELAAFYADLHRSRGVDLRLGGGRRRLSRQRHGPVGGTLRRERDPGRPRGGRHRDRAGDRPRPSRGDRVRQRDCGRFGVPHFGAGCLRGR